MLYLCSFLWHGAAERADTGALSGRGGMRAADTFTRKRGMSPA